MQELLDATVIEGAQISFDDVAAIKLLERECRLERPKQKPPIIMTCCGSAFGHSLLGIARHAESVGMFRRTGIAKPLW
jgi:hypothetical protein